MRGSKDAALALAFRVFLNSRIATIGEVTELSVDTGQQRGHLRIVLRGELRPVDVEVRKYAIDERDGRHQLTVLDARASHQWLDGLLQTFAISRPFPIPPTAARVLRLLT